MAGSSRDSAPVDFDVLDDMRTYLGKSNRFADVEWRPSYAPDSLVCIYDPGFYPAFVEDSSLEITWYKNDDFNIHYQENWASGEERNCRWDCHTNAHNTRGHYHPLPDAATPGKDQAYARYWKDVSSEVLSEIDDRIEGFDDDSVRLLRNVRLPCRNSAGLLIGYDRLCQVTFTRSAETQLGDCFLTDQLTSY